ncbi:MAG: sodium:solute symporter, partial [Acidimicrobiales bacterium]
MWILQTLPAVVVGLYTRWFDRRAQIVRWAVGMGLGTWMAVSQSLASTFPLHVGGFKFAAYARFFALIANLVVTALGTLVASAVLPVPRPDETEVADYLDLGEVFHLLPHVKS